MTTTTLRLPVWLIVIAMVGGVRLSQESWELQPAIEAPRYIGSGEQPQPPVDPVPSALSLDDVACAKASRTDENDADQKDKWDLCAQLRSARATERAVMEAKAQTVISLWGLGAIALSLLFTGWAAREAAKSAKAAVHSNTQARQFFEDERRPWIAPTVEIVQETIVGAIKGNIGINISLKNTGLTPAINVSPRVPSDCLVVRYTREDRNRLEMEMAKVAAYPNKHGVTIFPGDSVVVSENLQINVKKIFEERPPPSFASGTIVGLVEYQFASDPKGASHFTPIVYNILVVTEMRDGKLLVGATIEQHGVAPPPT